MFRFPLPFGSALPPQLLPWRREATCGVPISVTSPGSLSICRLDFIMAVSRKPVMGAAQGSTIPVPPHLWWPLQCHYGDINPPQLALMASFLFSHRHPFQLSFSWDSFLDSLHSLFLCFGVFTRCAFSLLFLLFIILSSTMQLSCSLALLAAALPPILGAVAPSGRGDSRLLRCRPQGRCLPREIRSPSVLDTEQA